MAVEFVGNGHHDRDPGGRQYICLMQDAKEARSFQCDPPVIMAGMETERKMAQEACEAWKPPAARWPALLGAFGFYCAMTAAYALAGGARLGSEFIGDGGDNWQFLWNAWWLKRCMLEGINPYYCTHQFAPAGAPLTMHNLVIVPTLVMMGLEAILGMPLAYNLVVLAFFPVAGVCAFALARYVTGEQIGALVGGALFMLCPYLTSKTLGHLNLLSAAFLPLYVLCLLKALDAPSRAGRIRLTLVFLLIVFSNEHTLVFAATVTAALWLFRCWKDGQWRAETRSFWQALKPALFFSLAWGAFLGYYAIRHGAIPYRAKALVYCPEPLNFILPLMPTSIWYERVALPGDWGRRLSLVELAVYLGWLVLPLAVAGYCCLQSCRMMKFMGLLFVGALAVALGPKLQWHREVVHVLGMPVYLPMGLFRYVPVLGSVGQSGRYLIIGYMAMSVAVAGLVCGVRGRWGKAAAAIAAVLALAMIGADYGYRLVLVPVPHCPIPPGQGCVMEVRENRPLGLYLQTIHERPLVGGYLARWPVGVLERYDAVPGVGWFFTPPKRRGPAPSSAELREGLRALNVEYVCADRAGPERQVLHNAGLELFHEDALGVTFRVR